MSESSYLPNHKPTPAYAALSYLGLHAHEKEWQHSIMSHCFNHKVSRHLDHSTRIAINDRALVGRFSTILHR